MCIRNCIDQYVFTATCYCPKEKEYEPKQYKTNKNTERSEETNEVSLI